MVTRDFDAFLADKAGVRPTFRLAGQTFTVKAKLPSKRFRMLLNQLTSEGVDEDALENEFLRLAIIPQDRERFFLLLDYDGEGDEVDEWSVVSPQQQQQLVEWLMELYTGKAEPSSGSSQDGSTTTGASQNVVSLNSRTQSA